MIKEMFNNKKKDEIELGFGNKNYNTNVRFLNRDGSVNVKRNSGSLLDRNDLYHWLITTSWTKFFLLVFVSYILTNTLFATIYFWIGAGNFGGLNATCSSEIFLQLFFFSAQTLTTVGYGHIYPLGSLTGSVAAIESMIGLLGFAMATGLLYGRFSRPKVDIEYSEKAVIAPYQEITGFMFRIANRKQNELIEIECQVVLAINSKNSGRREFHSLTLERTKINFLPLTWTIVHPIDINSPMYGLTSEDVKEGDAEFIILVKSINDTYSQTVYSRMSYKPNELEWNAKFTPVNSKPNKQGGITIDVSDIHQYQRIQ